MGILEMRTIQQLQQSHLSTSLWSEAVSRAHLEWSVCEGVLRERLLRGSCVVCVRTREPTLCLCPVSKGGDKSAPFYETEPHLSVERTHLISLSHRSQAQNFLLKFYFENQFSCLLKVSKCWSSTMKNQLSLEREQ
ncbi:hypothetical protein HJG60_007815 [Phyllostomus discolor]|uniref:Uncharacterized protein n=1 Tax=Phyllostomus discolor TaxID=89673 RepID=A0A834BD40_9CHIR|nr:hypothetical protein HJG60_007815 [Phyllostomus discolor]